jgi:hypothetical protein
MSPTLVNGDTPEWGANRLQTKKDDGNMYITQPADLPVTFVTFPTDRDPVLMDATAKGRSVHRRPAAAFLVLLVGAAGKRIVPADFGN